MNRYDRLLPNNMPRYIRCYDNGNKTIDRYTVVFTGNYVGREGRCHYLAMNDCPTSPWGFGQHGEHSAVIDRPSYRHLGKQIAFANLPLECQSWVMAEYKAIWNLGD